MIIARQFEFHAAHHLPNHPGKCRRPHGHSYRMEVSIAGPVQNDSGMVMDFADLKAIVKVRVLDVVDHRDLNKVLSNPTAENLVVWMWEQLAAHLPLHEITLHETSQCYVRYHGPEDRKA